MQDETCEYCNGELRPKTVTVHYRHKGKLVLIENVPARVCRRCGERYYEATTIEKMETIARRKSGVEKTVLVPIRDFTKTAA
jgi:HTH-type transcriptional regulator / antitoxin MqsA